jgi:membrane-bound lytic murein transglycosylase MltF
VRKPWCELRVATLNAPTTWYLGTHGPEGLEYELGAGFRPQTRRQAAT